MKVAFLSYGFGREVSGSSKYGYYLVNGLRKMGVTVDVFNARFITKTIGAPMFYFRNTFLKLSDYDVVHSNEGSGVFSHHPRMVDTYHHDYKQTYDINSLVFHNLEMMQCRKVQHVIVPSYATRNSLLHYGFDTDKITVIHHGVDPGVFRKNGSRDYVRKKYGISNHFVLVTVGKLIKRKRQIDIINALSGINDAALILVGKGEEESDIKRTARDKQVMLLHFKQVPERVLVDLYNAADAYVHSSVLEGFGLTILEAMACGLPIITYKTGDFTEIVRKAGIILQPSDVKGMRDAILRLKKKPNERALMSQLAQEESAKYTWDKTVKAHLNVYLRLMGE